jgi:hypothetical protein
MTEKVTISNWDSRSAAMEPETVQKNGAIVLKIRMNRGNLINKALLFYGNYIGFRLVCNTK